MRLQIEKGAFRLWGVVVIREFCGCSLLRALDLLGVVDEIGENSDIRDDG